MIDTKAVSSLILGRDFRQLAKAKDVYCPFEELQVSRVEIRHSNYLANTINPLGNHQFGDTIVVAVLDYLLSSCGEHGLRLELELSDLGRVEILREFKNIDLVIRLPDSEPALTCVIEIKVGSGEHGDQLKRYERIARQEWPSSEPLFFFLSADGAEASRDTWQSIGFPDLADALEDGLQGSSGTLLAREVLQAYIAMIRRQFMPDIEMEKLARRLWQTHGQTLEYLLDQRPSLMRDTSQVISSDQMMSEVFDEIEDKTGQRLALDASSSNTYLRLYVPSWGNNPNMVHGDYTKSRHLLVIECEFYGQRVHIRMMIGRGDPDHRQAIYNILKESGVDLGNSKKLTGQWTRLASNTIKRFRTTDDLNEMTTEDLVKISRKGIIAFAAEHLPEYTKAITRQTPHPSK